MTVNCPSQIQDLIPDKREIRRSLFDLGKRFNRCCCCILLRKMRRTMKLAIAIEACTLLWIWLEIENDDTKWKYINCNRFVNTFTSKILFFLLDGHKIIWCMMHAPQIFSFLKHKNNEKCNKIGIKHTFEQTPKPLKTKLMAYVLFLFHAGIKVVIK